MARGPSNVSPAHGEAGEATRTRRPDLDRPLSAAVLLAGVAVIAVAAFRLRNAYVGDAAVYLPFAKNAGNLGFFQFNPGEFSSGSTSPLWSALLGIPYLLGFGLTGAKAFAAASAAVALVALVWAAGTIAGSWLAAAAASLLALGTMTPFAASLYESGLVVTIGALALVVGARLMTRWSRDPHVTPRSLAPLATVWAALAVARPDCVILVLAQAAAMWLCAPVPRRRAALALLGALAVAALPAAAYYGFSLADLGTFSTSSQGRSQALREGLDRWVGPLYLNGATLRALFSSPWLFAIVPAIAGLGLAARARETRWIAALGALAVGGYLVLLTFVTPGYYDTSRYLVPLVPIVVVGAAQLVARARGTRLWLPAALAAALVIGLPSVLELRDYQSLARSLGISRDEVFERDVGALIDRGAKHGDVVLAYEVQMRYFLRDDIDVLSEDGITDGKVAPYQGHRDITAFLRRYRPAWWIADNNVATRPFLKGTVLNQALTAFGADPPARVRTLDGIRFELVARRDRPLARGFGGWLMLFKLSYPPPRL